MKLLLSAYACRPNLGSEPAVGWTWVVELCKYHDLWVLTNATNKSKIEEYCAANPTALHNVTFIYVRPCKLLTVFYKEWARLERLYYVLWQRKAYALAKQLHSTVCFDLVQHLTYVTCILPTYLHKLGVPFIYGPVSGGERIPKRMKYPMSVPNKIFELVRRFTQLMPTLNVNTRAAFKKATKIIAVTEETMHLIPREYQGKIVLAQAIGLRSAYFEPAPGFAPRESCRVLMAGRMIYWKGFEAGLRAALRAMRYAPNLELTILGSGNARHLARLKRLAAPYLGTKITFVDSVAYEQMKAFYEGFDVLLNCSLRDSGCLVVMEAMSRGLPVICIDTGGPKVNTTPECAIKIPPAPFESLVEALSRAITFLALTPEVRTTMSRAAYGYAKANFGIEEKVKKFLEYYAS